MSAVKWHQQPIVGFDTETTGTDPRTDRIVTAAIIYTAPARRPTTIQWIIHPGMDIPAEAAEVHGWTNERLDRMLRGHQAARLHSNRQGTFSTHMSADSALFEIAGKLSMAMHQGWPLVAYNAAYDLTLTEAELARTGVDTLASRPDGIRGVVDPMVIERAFDPYRKVKGEDGCRGGKHDCGGCGAVDKKLTSLCAHYGVRHTGAHDAGGDALAAVRLARRLAGLWPEVGRWKLATLHAHQVTWRREQCDGLRAYFDRTGVEHDGVNGGWPVYADEPAVAVAS